MNILLLNTFHFCTYSREIIDIFSYLTTTLKLAFSQMLFKGGLSNIAWGLPIRTRFDDLSLFQGHSCVRLIKCILFFNRFFSTVDIKQCVVATYIKKIKLRMLCVTGVYLRDITNFFFSPVLHLNVSHLSINSSCIFGTTIISFYYQLKKN